MAQDIQLSFPKNGRTLKYPHEPACFVAFGKAPAGSPAPTAVLKDGGGHAVGTATLLNGPPDWVIFFSGVPFGSPYTVEIRDGSGQVVAEAKNLKVKGVFGLGIMYPDAGENVCPSFVANGWTDQAGNVTCSLIKGSGPTSIVTDGETRQNGPDWVVQFRSVGELTYDKIRASVGTSSAEKANINVTSSAC